MAQACKVIAYACGYQQSDGHGNYWYDEYIDYVREKQIFTDFKAKDAFTREICKRIIFILRCEILRKNCIHTIHFQMSSFHN